MRSRHVRRIAALAALVAVAALVGSTALAQRRGRGGRRFGGGFGRFRRGAAVEPNAPYDGRFTFVRLRYGPPVDYVSQRVMWSHDYPAGERNFMKILNEISYLNPHTEDSDILPLDDPAIFKYPLVYLCEPGAWEVTEAEAANFRAYLQKGGFLIVDDFRAYDWDNFAVQMRRVLPGAQFVDLPASDPIFHSFFEIDAPTEIPQYYDPGQPEFRGVYQDNDRTKRLQVVIAYNTDISEFWEWSGTGFKPIEQTNDAYKIGVNFVIYGMTH